jgi:hypothetical protein
MGLMSLSRQRRLVVLLELWSCVGGYLAMAAWDGCMKYMMVMIVRDDSMSIIALLQRTELLYMLLYSN